MSSAAFFFLPDTQTLTSALERLGNFMADYKQKH